MAFNGCAFNGWHLMGVDLMEMFVYDNPLQKKGGYKKEQKKKQIKIKKRIKRKNE